MGPNTTQENKLWLDTCKAFPPYTECSRLIQELIPVAQHTTVPEEVSSLNSILEDFNTLKLYIAVYMVRHV